MIENPLRWPNGARCAVAFTFDMDAESLLHIYQPETAHNRLALSSMLRYGPEVAVPRIVATYRRFGLRQTFFIPGWCIEQYPRAVELILAGGHEIAHHGYLHEKPNQLTRAEEHDWLRRAIETITRATGRRPLGYRAPSYAFSRHTLELLLEEGFEYDASLSGHDIPYVLAGEGGRLVELPADVPLDDWTQYVCLRDFGYMLPIAAPHRCRTCRPVRACAGTDTRRWREPPYSGTTAITSISTRALTGTSPVMTPVLATRVEK